MSVVDVVVLSWLMAMSGAAAWAHRWAWHETPPEHQRARRLHHTTSALAAFYTIGYGVLASGRVPVATWSSFMRGVSLIAFPLVWVAPAVLAAKGWQRDRAAAARLVTLAGERTRDEVERPRTGG